MPDDDLLAGKSCWQSVWISQRVARLLFEVKTPKGYEY